MVQDLQRQSMQDSEMLTEGKGKLQMSTLVLGKFCYFLYVVVC